MTAKQTPDVAELTRRLQELETKCQELEAELTTSTKKIAAEKAKSEAIVAAIGDPVVIIDRDYKVLYQNRIATELFGENTGKYCYAVYQGGEQPCQECALSRAWQDNRIHKIDKTMASAKGMKYVEIAASPLTNCRGEVFAGIEIVRDVTKRRQTEEELRHANTLLKSILESTTDGILVVDLEDRLLEYNRQFSRMWNMPSQIMANWDSETAQHCVLDQLEHPDVFLKKIKELKKSPTQVELELIHFKDGRIFERYSLPLTVDGSHAGRVWSFRDITAKQQAEREKKNLIDDLQAALAEVKQLSGFLPICSYCKKIRDDRGYWQQIESYIRAHSEAEFSHSICPACMRENFPDTFTKLTPKKK